MGSILPFVNHSDGPLVTCAIAAADNDIQRPLWPGLWELDYPYRFGGLTSYFIVRSFDPNIHDVVRSVAAHFDAAWEQYVAEVSTITTFEDFGAAMGRLLAPTV